MGLARRLQLHELLLTLCPTVYFQEPQNVRLVYPCIIYKRDYIQNEHADNLVYKGTTRYQVTVIDQDPDSSIVDAVKVLPLCSFDRAFAAEQLNHDVFNLYF